MAHIPQERESISCSQCKLVQPQFDFVRAPAKYESPLSDAILKLKYGFRETMALPIGHLMAEYLKSKPFGSELGDIIIPVPLHPARLRERGFNQSSALAKVISRESGIPWSPKIMVRTRRTRSQASLKAAERRANVEGAFAVRDVSAIREKRIILIDDVLTTLFTVNECSKVLRESGAKSIWVLGAARDVFE